MLVIDNKNVVGIFRFESPSLVEDRIQEEGKDDRIPGMDITTDWYIVCILIEYFISILRRVLLLDQNNSSYKKTLLKDIHIYLSVFVLLLRT